MTLLEYIRNENKKKQEWVNAGPNRWTGMYSEDLSYWAERNIFTAEDLKLDDDRNMLYETVAHVYSKSYARGMDIWNMSRADVSNEIKLFSVIAKRKFEEEIRQSKLNVEKFEQRVEQVIETGAGNRETALRWIIQSEDFSEHDMMYGGSYGTYHFNLPSSYSAELDNIMNKMLKEAA